MTGGDTLSLIWKRMLGYFQKFHRTREYQNLQTKKEVTIKKISRQKLSQWLVNITKSDEGEKRYKTYFNVLERQHTNQKISELYTDNKKTKYSRNPIDILKLVKNIYEKLYTKKQSPKLLRRTFFTKISNKKNLKWTISPLRGWNYFKTLQSFF